MNRLDFVVSDSNGTQSFTRNDLLEKFKVIAAMQRPQDEQAHTTALKSLMLLGQLKPQIEKSFKGRDTKLIKTYTKAANYLNSILFTIPLTPEIKATKVRFREDYHEPDFYIPETGLRFHIGSDEHNTTQVESSLLIRKSERAKRENLPLVLYGQDIELEQVFVDGFEIGGYKVEHGKLIIYDLPPKDEFYVDLNNQVVPGKNKSCMGLFKSGNTLVTQNESQGFRHITYFIDRPDNMTKFSVRIYANKNDFPVLLSNGNEVNRSEGGTSNTHWVHFKMPTPMPCYLFALVAGDFGIVDDHYVTKTGRRIALQAIVEKGHEFKTYHALEVLKKAMRWDEEIYGCEYDLDILRLAAVKDFNYGAMENKGLIIFNTDNFYASSKTSTDMEFSGSAASVAHEYFHNWRGNNISIKSWHYLFTKEGLTTFTEQQFNEATYPSSINRIEHAHIVRTLQFKEDALPTARSLLPNEIIAMDNLYNRTTYEKGAEFFRMLHTLLGNEKYVQGMKIFFNKYLGKSITVEEIITSLEEAVKDDPAIITGLIQYRRWLHQAGTPDVEVEMRYDETKQEAVLKISQTCPSTSDTETKLPFYFPFKIALLDKQGKEIVPTQVLRISQAEQEFTFSGIKSRPIPSLLRDFSAPVKVAYDYTIDELLILMAHDSNPFSRYEATQRLAYEELRKMADLTTTESTYIFNPKVLKAFISLLLDPTIDSEFKACVLELKGVKNFEDSSDDEVYTAYRYRGSFIECLANCYEREIVDLVHSLKATKPYVWEKNEIGRRELRNRLLVYLSFIHKNRYLPLMLEQIKNADNLTDSLFALSLLYEANCKESQIALDLFYEKYKDDPIILCNWFTLQVASNRETVYEDVLRLQKHESYDNKNPNMINALIGCFIYNPRQFHHNSGRGYELIADEVLRIDKFNPFIAAKMCQGFLSYPEVDPELQKLMRKQIQRLFDANPSKDVYEILNQSIQ